MSTLVKSSWLIMSSEESVGGTIDQWNNGSWKKKLKKKKKDVVINTRQLNGYFHRLQWVGGQEEGS